MKNRFIIFFLLLIGFITEMLILMSIEMSNSTKEIILYLLFFLITIAFIVSICRIVAGFKCIQKNNTTVSFLKRICSSIIDLFVYIFLLIPICSFVIRLTIFLTREDFAANSLKEILSGDINPIGGIEVFIVVIGAFFFLLALIFSFALPVIKGQQSVGQYLVQINYIAQASPTISQAIIWVISPLFYGIFYHKYVDSVGQNIIPVNIKLKK